MRVTVALVFIHLQKARPDPIAKTMSLKVRIDIDKTGGEAEASKSKNWIKTVYPFFPCL